MACGTPFEPDSRAGGPARHAKDRSAWYVWLALCLLLGATWGYFLARGRSAPSSSIASHAGAIVLGGIAGVVLAALPGPLLRVLRRLRASLLSALCDWCASRRLSSIRRNCEEAIESGRDSPELRLRLASALWLQGARSQAEQLLAQILDSSDGPAVARQNFAVAQAMAGHGARAAQEFETVRSRLDNSADLFWDLGLARWRLGQFAAAAEAFRRAKELDPTDVAPRNALALALARQGELDRAIAELEAAFSVGPRHPDVLCNLGVIHQSRGELGAASHYFTAALRRRPAHVAARYNRALCSALDGRHHAALDDLGALAYADPDHARGLAQQAICRYRLGDARQARDAINNALRVSRGDFHVLYNTGTLLLNEALIDRALTQLERTYEIQPGSIDVIINLGVAVHLSGRLRQALDHFRAAVRMSPRHALARYNCAVSYSMADMLDQADRQMEELLALYPDFPEAFNAIGVIRLRQNRLVEAAEQFRRSADAMPRSAIVRSNLALTYYLEGDLAAAAEQARLAVARDPQLPAAHDIAAHAAMEMGNLPLAIEHFVELTQLETSNPNAHSDLGLAYYKADRLPESIESYKRVLIFSPKSPEGHNDLGLAYAKNDMLSEAASHLNKVIDWRPDNPVVHSNLGLVYYFDGSTEEAVHEWREVTRLSPAYARSREATRFSAYDDQEMIMSRIDRRHRASHFPLKVAAFHHSFQLALDENAYRLALPWPDLTGAARLSERGRRTRTLAHVA